MSKDITQELIIRKLADFYVDETLAGEEIDEQVTWDAFIAGFRAAKLNHQQSLEIIKGLMLALGEVQKQLELFNFAKDEIRVRNSDDIVIKALTEAKEKLKTMGVE